MKEKRIVLLPGDGIGPEITYVTKKLLLKINKVHNLQMNFQEELFGGSAIDKEGVPLPHKTLDACKESDAIILAAVGSPKYDNIERKRRPETGLLELRNKLELFANIRPVKVWDALIKSSSLKEEIIKGVDLIVVRELTGGIYFGEPKGCINTEKGSRAFNTMTYSDGEINRIAEIAFKISKDRNKKLCSVDKANVLEVSQLWRERVSLIANKYKYVKVNHLYVDNAAMQLVRDPRQFDVILTGNLFGDILSDEAAMLTGSIGMLPSASLSERGPGLFEPVHGSAPDIAGLDAANPIAMVLSASMMLRIAFKEERAADNIDHAVETVLNKGIRTVDLMSEGCRQVKCSEMGEELIQAL